jgi:hypothetical protein
MIVSHILALATRLKSPVHGGRVPIAVGGGPTLAQPLRCPAATALSYVILSAAKNPSLPLRSTPHSARGGEEEEELKQKNKPTYRQPHTPPFDSPHPPSYTQPQSS